jgi:histidinol phosphatase-like PHP family hydrolase
VTSPSDFVLTDLHGHSALSDGMTTPEAYVRARAAQGLEVIALSDHDILAGVKEAAPLAKSLGMTLLPAMETTSFIHFGTEAAEQIHVLAYFPAAMAGTPKLEQTKLFQRGLRVLEAWRRFVTSWLETLTAEQRLQVDPKSELPGLSAARFPGLAVLIARLVGEGVRAGESVPEAKVRLAARRPLVDAFLKHHVRFWTEDRELFGWSPEEMIETIRADGAIDVVAHPNRVRDTARMARVLELAQGVEVYTSRHSESVAAKFLDYATTHHKLWTASSDDHQHVRQLPYRRPPSGTPRRTVELLLSGR